MGLFSDDIAFKTIIGEGSSVKGDLRMSGMVRVEGDIDGNVETNGSVFISEKARIRGNVTARAVTVCGIVCGNITAPESVQLLSTSAVIGDIQTHRLKADADVIIQGHCIALSDGAAYEKAASTWSDTKAIAGRAAFLEPIRMGGTDGFSRQSRQQGVQPGDAEFVPVTLGRRLER